jgi:SAM-dependent methyltransferase
MGIDLHGFNFLRGLSTERPFGDVLTIGRQDLCVDVKHIQQTLGMAINITDGFCEPVLKALGAKSVASIDFSNYESPTHIADLNLPLGLDLDFDTVIDAGSLEHIFDIATALRNMIRLCRVGGRIVHILPVNNLSGHGFWQFTSDLIYTLYSTANGFQNTEVFYASAIDFSEWRKVPSPQSGTRVEVASIEPLILLSTSEKVRHIERLDVSQPFYQKAWAERDPSRLSSSSKPSLTRRLKRHLTSNRGVLINTIRNTLLLVGLAVGRSRFSIKRFNRFQPDRFSDNPKT